MQTNRILDVLEEKRPKIICIDEVKIELDDSKKEAIKPLPNFVVQGVSHLPVLFPSTIVIIVSRSFAI